MRSTARRVDELITVAAESRPDAVHLVLPDGSFARYADTAARARGLATSLAVSGVKSGDRVACFMGNSRELFEFFVACGLLNVIGVPLNTLNTAREIERIFADCKPAAFLASLRP
jgi:acyl-CoA synthetase (AMP-forming)/AMP-acid ligase II